MEDGGDGGGVRVRGGLRSETVAAVRALRGEEMKQEEVTPPPSPQSAAMLQASGFYGDRGTKRDWPMADGSDADEQYNPDSHDDENDDDEYIPGVSASVASGSQRLGKKKKKRRLRQGATPRRTHRAVDEGPRKAMEEEEEGAATVDGSESVDTAATSARMRGGRGHDTQQTWMDDGCAASFASRLEAVRHDMALSVRDGEETFYHRPQRVRVLRSADASEEELDDGGFHDDQGNGATVGTEQEQMEVPTHYRPDDVMVTDTGLSIPTFMYAHLFPHQKECLDWLHHLHERNTGGILGDEMGLGKTVQIATFLGAMYHARRVRSVLLLCPASVLLQWVREFHKWYPWVRVVLLHASGTGATRANRSYSELLEEMLQFDEEENEANGNGGGGVVISTYENVRQYQELFLDRYWDYVVLDEGHRIRNPDAEITLVCKQLRTVHRIILTGTPIQNRLRELWSLFDFVYPGKLGTLPTFDDEFVLPIRTGGYANASKMQIVMAYKCALALKDVINPFMLRRTKKEVQHVTHMPEKMEQIIFCGLTTRQYETYEAFLACPEVAAVLRQDIRPFRAISILRHICNHPDLLSTVGENGVTGLPRRDAGEIYGSADASGKMIVLQKILTMWKQQQHRVLLFTQTRKMLDILESFMARLGYVYCRLDGTTSVRERQKLIDAFNHKDSRIFIFLLTTRAGGIGVNLTGADRVVVFDPDWNPSTDLQARERSWRLGQTKQVTIYRLITSGTIEEKIYHRQIFKQYLTTKVLHDAKRKRCFNKHTLRELFVLGDQREESGVETTELLFEGNVERPGGDERGKAAFASDGDTIDTVEEGEVIGDEDDGNIRGASIDGEEADGKSSSATDNDAILQHLFDGDQVRGVFNHDVVESDGVQNQEADLIEMEASKIAQSALSSLRASCALIQQQRESIFSPTWTGRSGVAGDPNQRAPNLFGNRAARSRNRPSVVNIGRQAASSNPFEQSTRSSRDLLAHIKNRKLGASSTGSAVRRSSPSLPGARKGKSQTTGSIPRVLNANGFMSVEEMTKQLHAFLARQRTGVTTEALLDAFSTVIAPKDKLVFRNLLRDMAVCRARRWQLKQEFATASS